MKIKSYRILCIYCGYTCILLIKKISCISCALILVVLSVSFLFDSCKKDSYHYTIQGTITERVIGNPVIGVKVFLTCQNVDVAPLILWDDSTYSDDSGNFTFEYSGANNLEDHGFIVNIQNRGWDCDVYANPTFTGTLNFVNLYTYPSAAAAIYFHNTTGDTARGASVPLFCLLPVTISGQASDTIIFKNIAGGKSYKFDWNKTVNGNITETVLATDSTYVAPGDTMALYINY
jgi:hypothetical protein